MLQLGFLLPWVLLLANCGVPTVRTPTQAPLPTADAVPITAQKIGPIVDTLHDEKFSVEMLLKDVKWTEGSDYSKPKSGNIYVITYIHMKNLGPGRMHDFGSFNLQVLDSNGNLQTPTLGPYADIRDCDLGFGTDLLAEGTLDGCIAFEVPSSGKAELIYAPYDRDNLKPGRAAYWNRLMSRALDGTPAVLYCETQHNLPWCILMY